MGTRCANIVAICWIIFQIFAAFSYGQFDDFDQCISNCSDPRIDELAAFLFEESGAECLTALATVGMIVLNRMNNSGYPDTLHEVLQTLNISEHDIHNMTFEEAKENQTTEYNDAETAAKMALCQCQTDLTGGSTAYCNSTNIFCLNNEEVKCFAECINGPEEIDLIARIVFGEARGECIEEQLALAYSIANRVNHTGYPDTIEGVIGKMYKKGRVHEYNTLDNHNHNSSFEEARMQHTAAYNLTIGVSVAAICQCKPDPTNGATDFCVPDPSKGSCSATEDNKYYRPVNNIRIGQHMFASHAQIDSVQLIGK